MFSCQTMALAYTVYLFFLFCICNDSVLIIFVKITVNNNKFVLLLLKHEIVSILIILAIYAYGPTWQYVRIRPSMASSEYSLYIKRTSNMRYIFSRLPFLYAHTQSNLSKHSPQTRVLLIFKTLDCTFLLRLVW